MKKKIINLITVLKTKTQDSTIVWTVSNNFNTIRYEKHGIIIIIDKTIINNVNFNHEAKEKSVLELTAYKVRIHLNNQNLPEVSIDYIDEANEDNKENKEIIRELFDAAIKTSTETFESAIGNFIQNLN